MVDGHTLNLARVLRHCARNCLHPVAASFEVSARDALFWCLVLAVVSIMLGDVRSEDVGLQVSLPTVLATSQPLVRAGA